MTIRRKPVRDAALLKARLDALVTTFDLSTIAPDPLELPRRYADPRDQEVAALIAAAFAYGRADIIVSNIGRMLSLMGESPYAYLRDGFTREEAMHRFSGFSHRFHKTRELVALLGCIARVLREHGSLGALFEKGYRADDADIGAALGRFVEAVIGGGGTRGRGSFVALRAPQDDNVALRARQEVRALRYLLTSPADGSACKRMNLFLRWMVRRESPDLARWTFVDPAKLVIPLDTHVHRITTFLGLGTRKSADWKAARAITDALARFDPADPVRYDFAICRLGILNHCSVRRKKEQCDVCQLRDVCRFPVG
ncbi:MAG: TIGR02757 family protein [Thermoanaerobaculia bacterium]